MTLEELKNSHRYQSADISTKALMIRGSRLNLTDGEIDNLREEFDIENFELILRGLLAISNNPIIHSQGST